MNSCKEHYSELVALTQLYLLRGHSMKDKQVANPQTYAFFKKLGTLRTQISTPSKEVSSIPRLESPKNPPMVQPPVIRATNPPPQPDPFPPQTQPEPHPSTPNPSPTSPPITTPEPSPNIPDPRPPEIQDPPIMRSSTAKFAFTLDPLQAPKSIEYQDFKQMWKEQFPRHSICESIPSDHLARKRNNAWQLEKQIPPIIILSFNDQNKPLAFLKNVAQAISLHLAPARVMSGPKLEQEKKWDLLFKTPELRLIIASDYGLYLLPELMKHYKEFPQRAKHALAHIPLLLLSDPSLYLKEPQLKPLLWRAICTEFHASHVRST